jgi:chitodextrinase
MSVRTATPREIISRLRQRTATAVANQRVARRALSLLAGSVILALGPVSGTAAFWAGSVDVRPGTLTAGSVTADVAGFTGLDHTFTRDALSTTSYATIANAGTSTAAFTVAFSLGAGSSAALADDIGVNLWLEASPAACTSSALVGAYGWAGTWATSPQFSGSLPGSTTAVVCIRTRMQSDALATSATVYPTVSMNLSVPGTGWASSDSVSATQKVLAPGLGGTDYTDQVFADGATRFWRLGESSGNILYDWVGTDDAYVAPGATRAVAGPVGLAPDTATTFPGTISAGTRTAIAAPQSFAVEAWFKTTTTTGGKIVGFGDATTGASSSNDRHIYMDAAGKVSFGVWPNAASTITTTAGFNDGQWHHVVGNLGAGGQELYIDGARIGQNATTSSVDYTGYWRIGGDTTWAGDMYFDGDIDDVAIYGAPLSATKVSRHFNVSGEGALPLGVGDPYGSTVYADSPSLYWRFGESAGTVAADSSGTGNTGAYFGAVTKPIAGGIPNTRNTAASFNGTDGLVASTTLFTNPQNYTAELWFNTTSTTGGKLIGFGSSQTGSSTNYDRHVYLQNDGKVVFGSYPGSTQTATSTAAYNDGTWHHVVATQSSTAGMLLYIDGVLVADNPAVNPQNYNGYWRVGGDNLTSWPGIPTTPYVTAKIDEVAVYPTALTEAQAKQHYAAATGTPIGLFTASTTGMTVGFNATSSSDPDGSISSYSWNFGDGTTGTGATPSRTFTTPGPYDVTLTVTDNDGKRSVAQGRVTARDITAPTAPGAPASSANTGTSVSLSWPAATDDVGVTRYQVFRDGALLTTVSGTSYTDSSTATGTTYTYTIKARDAADNLSPASSPLSVTTHLVNTAAWYTASNLYSGSCITAAGTAVASALQQKACATPAGANQAFRFIPTDNGYFKVLSRGTTLIWDVASASIAENAQIVLNTDNTGTNQQWKLTKNAVDGSMSFTGRASDKCLQFAGGSNVEGAQLQQATCAATNYQRFNLAATS